MKIKYHLFPLYGLILLLANTPGHTEATLVTVQPSFRQVTVTGFTRARTAMTLSSEVAGQVDNVYAEIGEAIPATGKFACLDDTFVDIDIQSAENNIAQHAIDIGFYKKQVARHQQLVATNSSAISHLDDLKRQLGNSRRSLHSDRLQKKRLEELRKRHCIDSPAGWRVIERYIEPGQWIDAGTPIAKVGNYSHLLVPLALSAKELNALQQKLGTLKVRLSEYEQLVPAAIERISPAFDEQSHKIRVDLQIEEDLPENRGGMRVELLLEIPDEFSAFLIPKQALDERFEEVWLRRDNGESIRVKLLGYLSDDTARITSPDIKLGDKFKIVRR